MKIKKRITLSISILSILFLLMAGLSLVSTINILRWEDNIYSIRLTSIQSLIESDRDAYQSFLSMTQLLWQLDSASAEMEDNNSLISKVRTNKDEVLKQYSIFHETLPDVPQEIFQLKRDFTYKYSTWSRITDEIVSGAETNTLYKAMELFGIEYGAAFNDMRGVIAKLIEYSQETAKENHLSIQDSGQLVLTLNLILGAIGIIVNIITFIIVYSLVIRPIRLVNTNVSQLSQGTGDLTIRLPERGKDEMTELSSHVNSFIEKTQTILTDLKKATNSTQGIKSNLISAVEENTAAAIEISANITSIADQIHTQDSGIQKITTNLNSMKKSLGVFDDQVSNQAAMVEESTASVTEMIASIQNLANIAQNRKEATEKLRQTVSNGEVQVNRSDEAVQAINEDIDAISDMTKVITNITSETNLLAMNAAIEAAHAGDAGKGFTVVADEIRKLAETSSEQSKSINTALKNVIDKIKNASEASNFTSKAYKEILSEFSVLSSSFEEIVRNSQELDIGGRQILDAMASLQDQSLTVKNEASTIRSSNDQMNHEMNGIANVSSSVKLASDEMNHGMREISMSLEYMKDLSIQLEDAMKKASQVLAKFVL